MADRIKKRLESTRGFFQMVSRGGEIPEGIIRDIEKWSPQAVEDAARFFGLDFTRPDHRDALLKLLADAIFKKEKAGRRQGTKTWHSLKLLILGGHDARIRRENPELRGALQIAKKIKADDHWLFKRDSAVTIRQRLAAARQEYAKRPKAPSRVRVLGGAPPTEILGL